MSRRALFPVRGASEAQAILHTRRLQAEVDRVRARSNLWRRLLCLLLPHRPWSTGLAGRAPDGTPYALVVCRRCGKRFAGQIRAVRP